LLEASRRIDWRFLLPDPELRDVAYLGTQQPVLIDALRRFSRSLCVMEAVVDSGVRAEYDLVVLSQPGDDGLLQHSAELARPGGYLYVEARRSRLSAIPRWGRKGKRLRRPSDYIARLLELGLTDAEAWWHWPDFERCGELVPLADRRALLLSLARRHGSPAKSLLARWLVRLGLFEHAVACFSVLARKVPSNGRVCRHLGMEG
jgi:hypothetical protein